MFGKSWKTRLTECYTYIAGLHLSEEKLENLRNAVNRHTSYTPEEISKAISLPSIPRTRPSNCAPPSAPCCW